MGIIVINLLSSFLFQAGSAVLLELWSLFWEVLLQHMQILR